MQAARVAEEAGGHAAARRELAAAAAAAAATQERLQRELAKAGADLAESARALGEARAAEAAAMEVRGFYAGQGKINPLQAEMMCLCVTSVVQRRRPMQCAVALRTITLCAQHATQAAQFQASDRELYSCAYRRLHRRPSLQLRH
jgi:hypothetical protein